MRIERRFWQSGFGRLLVLGSWLGGVAMGLQAQTGPVHTQAFRLHPGWNSIFLEVQPEGNTPGEIFRDIPLESVWTLRAPALAVEFIQDPEEPLLSQAEWLRYIPTNRVESFQNNLFRMHARRAYLVKVSAAAPVTLRVTGRPQARPLSWKPDAFMLRGFAVSPEAPPTFATFFRGSRAHYDPVLKRLQQVYRLNAAGEWTLVDPDDRMASGEAYWVFTKGSSEYQGPFTAQVLAGDGLDFGTTTPKLSLTVANFTSGNLAVTLRDLGLPGENILAYSTFDVEKGVEFLPLPSPFQMTLASVEASDLSLAVRRQDMAGEHYSTILEANDGAGTRLLIPVTASRVLGEAEAQLVNGASANGLRLAGTGRRVVRLSPAEQSQSHVGLWSGVVTIEAVSEAHSANPDIPKPVANPFNLRMILHVDSHGTTRLLKEVIQMAYEGAYAPNELGQLVKAEPDRIVLVTDFSKLALFRGVTMRDGQSQGRRISSIGFDFASHPTENFVPMTGLFGVGQTIEGILRVPAQHPTNPFLHRYHPDHDNLAADFRQYKEEAYPVSRTVELEFLPPPSNNKTVDYGYNAIAGNYRETLSGLHRRDLKVSGTFQLHRLTTVGVLNE